MFFFNIAKDQFHSEKPQIILKRCKKLDFAILKLIFQYKIHYLLAETSPTVWIIPASGMLVLMGICQNGTGSFFRITFFRNCQVILSNLSPNLT
jgi:hypothetical protein